jgi:hypothetical protein
MLLQVQVHHLHMVLLWQQRVPSCHYLTWQYPGSISELVNGEDALVLAPYTC